MSRSSTCLFAALFTAHLLAHTASAGVGGLRGFVTDSTSGEALPYANVAVGGTRIGAATTIRGYYFIPDIPAGRQTITVSYLGYHPRSFTVIITDGQTLSCDVGLLPGWIELEGLTVLRQTSPDPARTEIGLTRITPRGIALVPPGLDADIFRVLQAEPGVGTTGDISARYYVRGGSGDQNLLLLDGATIYNPFHALGIFSVVDPEIIAGMEFYKGGFTPEHSGRLSSILTIVSRDGNKNRFGGSAQVGLLSAKAAVEGPIPAGSFLVAGRKSHSIKALQRYLPGKENPFEFYDLSFKVNTADPVLGENSKIVLSGFLSDDRVRNNDPLQEDYYVRNNILALTWHTVWASPLVSAVRLTYSGYDGELLLNSSTARARSNTVRDYQASADFTYMYTNRDELVFGAHTKHLSTVLTMQNLFGVLTSYDARGTELHAYAAYRFRRSDAFGMTLGVRTKLLALTKNHPTFIEPRVSAYFAPLPTLTLKAAAGWYAQEVVTLTDETEVLSVFDPWVLVPDDLGAPQAWHFIAGAGWYPHEHLYLECEAYYKPMHNLMDINEAKLKPEAADFINVPGRAYGVEGTLRFDQGFFSLQGSYALGRAERTRYGKAYTPKYDVRHTFHALASYAFGSELRISASWTVKSGLPFTPAVGFYDRLALSPGSPNSIFNPYTAVTLWGTRNSSRLPAYHRLDVSASSTFAVHQLMCTVEVSLMNLYDRKNIFYYDRDTGEEVTMLRFFPSISLRVVL